MERRSSRWRGAALLLGLGLLSPLDAFRALAQDWNTSLFFLGMMGLSALAEAAGLFDWLAAKAARLAGQSAARLFVSVFLLGSLRKGCRDAGLKCTVKSALPSVSEPERVQPLGLSCNSRTSVFLWIITLRPEVLAPMVGREDLKLLPISSGERGLLYTGETTRRLS